MCEMLSYRNIIQQWRWRIIATKDKAELFGDRKDNMSCIGVIGAGIWGMALARMLSNSGHDITVWSALPTEVEELDIVRPAEHGDPG